MSAHCLRASGEAFLDGAARVVPKVDAGHEAAPAIEQVHAHVVAAVPGRVAGSSPRTAERADGS